MTINEMNLLAANAARSAAPVFQVNEWTWTTDDGGYEVPGPARLEKAIARLLRRVMEEPDQPERHISSGRFSVSRTRDGDDTVVNITLDLADIWSTESVPYEPTHEVVPA